MASPSVLIFCDQPYAEAATLGPYRFTLNAHMAAVQTSQELHWLGLVAPAPDLLNMAKETYKVDIAATGLDQLGPLPTPDVAVILTAPEYRADIIQRLTGVRWIVTESPLGLGMADTEALEDFCRTNGVQVLASGAWRADPLVEFLANDGVREAVGAVQGVTGWYGQGLWQSGVQWVDLCQYLIGPVASAMALEDARYLDRPLIPEDQSAAFCLSLNPRGAAREVTAAALFRDQPGFAVQFDIFGDGGRLSLTVDGDRSLMELSPNDGPVQKETAPCGAALSRLYANLAACAAGTGDPVCPITDIVEAERIIEAVLNSADQGGERYHFR